MAKGFGKIVADVSTSIRKANQRIIPVCPLCGRMMKFNGVASFCSHPEFIESCCNAAYKYHEGGGILFFSDMQRHNENHWNPEFQGAIIAAAISPSGEEVYFSTVRGDGGKTVFKVDMPDSGWVPQAQDWNWAEWTGQ